jgi:uncharacterized protein YacL
MEKIAAVFERVAVSALIVLLMATILFGTVVVAWSLIEDLLRTRELVAEPRVLFDIFGLFVAVLVGVVTRRWAKPPHSWGGTPVLLLT